MLDFFKIFCYNITIRKIKKKGVNSMLDKNEVLTRLQNGEDPQKLAETIASSLNETIMEYEKAEKQKRLEAAIAKQKANDAQKVIDITLGFLETYYPQLVNDTVKEEVTGDVLIQLIDESVEEINAVNSEIEKLKAAAQDWHFQVKDPKSLDKDPIAEFLAEFVNN
jgi:glycine cleavage system protein P-like pyridoxal-binding family